MDESKHEIHSQVDAITAGTASMVNLTGGRNTRPQVGGTGEGQVGGGEGLLSRDQNPAAESWSYWSIWLECCGSNVHAAADRRSLSGAASAGTRL